MPYGQQKVGLLFSIEVKFKSLSTVPNVIYHHHSLDVVNSVHYLKMKWPDLVFEVCVPANMAGYTFIFINIPCYRNILNSSGRMIEVVLLTFLIDTYQ